jgi:hypothetical protein
MSYERSKTFGARIGRSTVCAMLGTLALAHFAAAEEPYALAPVMASTQDNPPNTLASLSSLQQYGIDLGFWTWASYANSDLTDTYNTWSAEAELDVTKTFQKTVSLSADMEWYSEDGRSHWDFEQLFTSILLSRDKGIVLTIGKFNSPTGLEGHDFWDRTTATPSLLYYAQPRDLRGVMLTAPIADTHVKLRTYAVSGFADEDYRPQWPSVGVTAEYRPDSRLNAAITGFVGPGLTLESFKPYGYHWGGSAEDREYAAVRENYWLTDPWWTPKFTSADEGVLMFFNAHATFKIRPDLTLAGEFVYGQSEAEKHSEHWIGVSTLLNFDVDDHLRVYGMWSYIDDTDWLVWPEIQRRHSLAVGVGYWVNSHLELRAEYRRDISDAIDDMNTVTVDVGLGY